MASSQNKAKCVAASKLKNCSGAFPLAHMSHYATVKTFQAASPPKN